MEVADDFISFGRNESEEEEEEEEEVANEEGEEEPEEGEAEGDYDIEDILRKAAISLKKQLDQLELQSDHIPLGEDKLPEEGAAEPKKMMKREIRLESGLEKTRRYLQEVGEKNKLPAAVKVKTTDKERGEIKKPRGPRGLSWGTMRAPRSTKARREQYKVILLRAQLDPKRRYKRLPDKIPKVFQIGRVVSGPGEFYSGRLTRKEQRNNLVDELLADRQLRLRSKRKYAEITKERMSGKGTAKKRKMDRMPKWKKKFRV